MSDTEQFQDIKSPIDNDKINLDVNSNDILEEDDTPKIAGVETNEASRFVDYTIATSWEQLIADIESYIKKVMKEVVNPNPIDISYEGFNWLLTVETVDKAKKSSDFLTKVHSIPHWFNLCPSTSRYFILSGSGDGTEENTSLHRRVFSALVSALDSCRCHLPAFILQLPLRYIESCSDVLGYHIHIPNEHGIITTHYESIFCTGVHQKHDFFYLDGIMRLFQAEINSNGITFGSNSIIPKDKTSISLWEQFEYVPNKYSDNELNSSGFSSIVSDYRHHPVLSSALDDLCAPYYTDRGSTALSLSSYKVTVQLYFKDLKYTSVVDNDYFTTLLPSKLSPPSWSCRVQEVKRGTMPESNSHVTLSTSLRKILGCYVCGMSCMPDFVRRSMRSWMGKDRSEILDVQKVRNVSTILSKESRFIIEHLSTNGLRAGEDDHDPSQNLPHDLLMRVFSRSLWIGGEDNAPIDGNNDALFFSDNLNIVDDIKDKLDLSFGSLPAPWSWLRGHGTAPVSSWLSLVAMYMSSMSDIPTMSVFWKECLKELRMHWENKVPIPRLHAPVPILQYNKSKENSKAKSPVKTTNGVSLSLLGSPNFKNSDKPFRVPLWEEPLWDDVIEKQSTSGIPFSYPDTSQCLAHQKLQMVNMCIMSVEENQSVVLSSIPRLLPDNSNEHDNQEFVVPMLIRRLPMTSDALTQHKHLAEKVNGGNSKNTNDNPILRWQISLPSLVSDIKSFKAYNPDASKSSFLSWYLSEVSQDSLVSDGINYLEAIEEIWECTEGLHPELQKQLFKAEQEAEKALGYLESLTLSRLAETLFCSVMTSVHMIIFYDLKQLISLVQSDVEIAKAIKLEIDKFTQMIKQVIDLVQINNSGLSNWVLGMNNSETSLASENQAINQELLLAMDAVCCNAARLEQMKSKFELFYKLFDGNIRLAYECCSNEDDNVTVTAENPEEASMMFALAKCASLDLPLSAMQDTSMWHSYDGRELSSSLGVRHRKIVEAKIKCNRQSDDTHDYYVMKTILEHEKLRVSFSLPEKDITL